MGQPFYSHLPAVHSPRSKMAAHCCGGRDSGNRDERFLLVSSAATCQVDSKSRRCCGNVGDATTAASARDILAPAFPRGARLWRGDFPPRGHAWDKYLVRCAPPRGFSPTRRFSEKNKERR